jgi:exonuclease III
MRVLTWNMAGFTPNLNSLAMRAKAWAHLAALDPQPDFALLQEASAPLEGFPGLVSGAAVGIQARIWTPSGALLEPSTLEDVRSHGWVAMGQASSSVGPITLISLHARTQGSAVAHIEELLDRLSGALGSSFILAGDFNSCRLADQVWPGYRHLEFFDGAETRYGMVNCFWRENNREQRTYWPGCRDAGKPFQADHIFVSADLQDRVRSCAVLDYEAFRGISDHTPMVLVIDL